MNGNMNRRNFIKKLGLSTAVLTGARLGNARSTAPKKPNIVVFYADDLDFDDISLYDITRFPCYTGAKKRGYYRIQKDGWFVQNDTRLKRGEHGFYDDERMLAPHIASLADQGARFSRFYITSSICTPSRYGLLTGRYATRSPYFLSRCPAGTRANLQWDAFIDGTETTLVKEMKKAGYKTGFVGKWHNGAPNATMSGVAPDADPYDPAIQTKIMQPYQRGIAHLKEKMGFDFAERGYFENKEQLGLPKRMQVHNLEWITEGALKFIDESAGSPFFLYMPLTEPHGQYYSEWAEEDALATPAGMLEKVPDVQPSRKDVLKRVEAAGIDKRNAMATWIDDSVGAVLKKLKDRRLEDDTAVIFTSDHQSRGKCTCYEGCRVPFIIRWPGRIKPGSWNHDLTANIDIAATLLDIAGAVPPADMVRDGRSFLPRLLNGRQPGNPRRSLLLECSYIRAVVTERWKYIANRPTQEIEKKMQAEAKACEDVQMRRIDWSGRSNWHSEEQGVIYGSNRDFLHYFDPDQLYDLEADPFEQNNRIADERCQEQGKLLKEEMKRILETLPHEFAEFTPNRGKPR
jgi:arylsulfatase A-like enzyme